MVTDMMKEIVNSNLSAQTKMTVLRGILGSSTTGNATAAEVKESEHTWIDRARTLRNGGATIPEIATALNAEGYRTVRGNKFRAQTVYNFKNRIESKN